jgi:hypothetical protein
LTPYVRTALRVEVGVVALATPRGPRG